MKARNLQLPNYTYRRTHIYKQWETVFLSWKNFQELKKYFTEKFPTTSVNINEDANKVLIECRIMLEHRHTQTKVKIF